MRATAGMAILFPFLVGCTTLPRAEIALIQEPSDLTGKELDTYAFPQTIVSIALNEDQTDIIVAVNSKSYEAFRIALRRSDAFGVKTNLNLTKISNSDMVDEAGVEVFDNRLKTIGELGKFATTLFAMAAASPTGDSKLPKLPVSFDAMAILDRYNSRLGDAPGDRHDVPGIEKVTYWLGPVQPDARLVESGAFGMLKNGLVYSSCREIMIFVGDRQPVSIYVSDPRYFRYVQFPQKGKVKVHAQCGTSVSSEKDENVASDAAVGNAILDELKKLKDAMEENKKDGGQ